MVKQDVPLSYIDLHVHTTCSDGTLSPEKVVRLAASEKIGVLAITDHDNIDGIQRAKVEAQKFGIKIIPGIECSTTFDTGKRHILGYHIDPANEDMIQYVKTSQNDRIEKINRILEKLGRLGFKLSFHDVKKFSNGNSIGRLHIAQAMLEKGYVDSLGEAFKLYIGKGCPAYASVKSFSIEDVIAIIKSAGGIPVIAHPFQMNNGDRMAVAKEINHLITLGIEGIEVIYPEHYYNENYFLVMLAFDKELFVTCGSDFHGTNKKIQLGRCFFNKYKVTTESLKKMGKTFV